MSLQMPQSRKEVRMGSKLIKLPWIKKFGPGMQLLQNACCRSFHIQSRSAKGRHVGLWEGGGVVDGSLGVTCKMVYMDKKSKHKD